MMITTIRRSFGTLLAVSAFALASGSVSAYTGTECKEPGNCWQPKPGYPDQIAGSKYDPKHDPKEVAKQQESIQAMETRNKQRVEHFKKTGEFIYDVKKIPAS
ncbi:methanol dehydrogenase [cytochrome c] subunit [Paenalcaligenes niemegkensis]|uniref:methanol dehydrogenase [cytochrome c] subunit n=1 Tax=Paenalcaligenes niemegkensis TaxID=2895469 RepID=UPI001EE7E923|nr:methanol dehydrogenase [cytochrome c] subunit [Paenalcaligenes niemegkensis]MCQ9615832.1 methanol dehydrogenase [cytochrome c] subunit [Paenalcaligenes niemegkensis]